MSSSPLAIVRVKRKRSEDPAKALVLSFKRRRETNDYNDDDSTANEIFRFTATAPVLNDGSGEDLTETREQLREIISNGNVRLPNRNDYSKFHVADIRMKSKRELEESIRRQRESLLLSFRCVDMPDLSDEDSSNDESRSEAVAVAADGNNTAASSSLSTISCNGQPLLRVSQESMKSGDKSCYVFDYYVSSIFCDDEGIEEGPSGGERRRRSSPALGDAAVDVTEYFNNLIAVYPYNVCDNAVDEDPDANASVMVNFDEDEVDDDEDSNAESNWKNEYPDEDEEFENRYDFYDQTYPSGDETDEGLDSGITDHIQRLQLGKKTTDYECSDKESDDGFDQFGSYTNDK